MATESEEIFNTQMFFLQCFVGVFFYNEVWLKAEGRRQEMVGFLPFDLGWRENEELLLLFFCWDF